MNEENDFGDQHVRPTLTKRITKITLRIYTASGSLLIAGVSVRCLVPGHRAETRVHQNVQRSANDCRDRLRAWAMNEREFDKLLQAASDVLQTMDAHVSAYDVAGARSAKQ